MLTDRGARAVRRAGPRHRQRAGRAADPRRSPTTGGSRGRLRATTWTTAAGSSPRRRRPRAARRARRRAARARGRARAWPRGACAVTLLHAAGHLMERQLDPEAGAVLGAAPERLGVGPRAEPRVGVAGLTAGGWSVALGDGLRAGADLVVLACGVAPATGWPRRPASTSTAASSWTTGCAPPTRRLRHRRLRPARRTGSPGWSRRPGSRRRWWPTGRPGPTAPARPPATVTRLKAEPGRRLAAMGARRLRPGRPRGGGASLHRPRPRYLRASW